MYVRPARAYFYSSLYETNVSQYLKLVVINFLGNAFKLSSNVFYLMFAFSRMILIRFERKNVTQKEKHTNVIRIFIHFLLILISFCIKIVSKDNQKIIINIGSTYSGAYPFTFSGDVRSLFVQKRLGRCKINTFFLDFLLLIENVSIYERFYPNMIPQSAHFQ